MNCRDGEHNSFALPNTRPLPTALYLVTDTVSILITIKILLRVTCCRAWHESHIHPAVTTSKSPCIPTISPNQSIFKPEQVYYVCSIDPSHKGITASNVARHRHTCNENRGVSFPPIHRTALVDPLVVFDCLDNAALHCSHGEPYRNRFLEPPNYSSSFFEIEGHSACGCKWRFTPQQIIPRFNRPLNDLKLLISAAASCTSYRNLDSLCHYLSNSCLSAPTYYDLMRLMILNATILFEKVQLPQIRASFSRQALVPPFSIDGYYPLRRMSNFIVVAIMVMGFAITTTTLWTGKVLSPQAIGEGTAGIHSFIEAFQNGFELQTGVSDEGFQNNFNSKLSLEVCRTLFGM